MRTALLAITAGGVAIENVIPGTEPLKAIAVSVVVQAGITLGKLIIDKLRSIHQRRRARKASAHALSA